MTKSTGKLARRRFFNCEEIAVIRARYPDTPTEQLARDMGRPIDAIYRKAFTLGLHKSAAYLASPDACRLRRGDNVGAEHRFPPGHVPANKGQHKPGWAPGRMHETQFKSGQRGNRFVPVGSERLMDGYLQVKINDTKYHVTNWAFVHVLVWELHNGPVPTGHAIAFKDGNRMNFDPSNLEKLTRQELMARNTIHRYPPALKTAIRLARKVQRKIHEQEHR